MQTRYAYLLVYLFMVLSTIVECNAQVTNVRNFIFGHSLIDHRPPLYPTPSDETTVPHWVALLAGEAGYDYVASGQYGFLPQHANLAPFSQWGYDIVDPAWDSDLETFGAADFNTILITAGNFIQYQGPDEAYYNDPNMTPISATQDITDWLNNQETDMRIFLYENWPDMAGFIAGETFPPTAAEFSAYNDYLKGDFHNWWLEYHDALIATRPDQDIRMIPVGPILADLLEDGLLSQIDINTLYEDNAPHGRPTVYFLAGLVTYMAMFEERAPLTYEVPSIVDVAVANQYEAVVNFMWDALQNFTTDSGESRVFSPDFTLPVAVEYLNVQEVGEVVQVDWGVASDASMVTFTVEHAMDGNPFRPIGTLNRESIAAAQRNFSFQHTKPAPGQHYYRLKQTDPDGTYEYSTIRSIQIKNEHSLKYVVYPNPVSNGVLYLQIPDSILGEEEIEASIFDTFGRMLYARNYINPASVESFSLRELPAGVYMLQLKRGYESYTELITVLRE